MIIQTVWHTLIVNSQCVYFEICHVGARGFLKFSNWYDKQEGNDKTRWRMILRLKDISKGYFKRSIRTDGLENPNNVEANTYSIIGQLNPDSYKAKLMGNMNLN